MRLLLPCFIPIQGSEPNAETYSIIDNIKIYTPNNDATLGDKITTITTGIR